MFCPNCGQERLSVETNFCSKCGYLLTGTASLMDIGGSLPTSRSSKTSPRKRGLKQGLFIFLLVFLLAPIFGIISMALRVEPIAVGIVSILCTMGGMLRMVYALMFESAAESDHGQSDDFIVAANLMGRKKGTPQLPHPVQQPARSYTSPSTGKWRDTNDLEPSSVTDHTTKLLEREEQLPQ